MRAGRATLTGTALSCVVHACVAAWLLNLPAPAETARAAASSGPTTDAAAHPDATRRDSASVRRPRPASRPPPLPPSGHRSTQNVDARHPGGGSAGGAERVIWMVSRAHDVLLSDVPANAVDAQQIQRIRTARERASLEDRRATPSPADAHDLTTGEGRFDDRYAPGRVVPAPGGLRRAATGGTPAATGGDTAVDRGETTPGRGIARGTGRIEMRRAPLLTTRPSADAAHPEVPSRTRAVRPADDISARQAAALRAQSWVDASPRAGSGEPSGGGASSRGGAGDARGRGEGGDAAPTSPGPRTGSLDRRHPRYIAWFRQLRRGVRIRFPPARAAALDQGRVGVRVRLAPSGRILDARVFRTSGFPDMDTEALRAVRANRPPPIPAVLLTGRASYTVDVNIQFRNPMVH